MSYSYSIIGCLILISATKSHGAIFSSISQSISAFSQTISEIFLTAWNIIPATLTTIKEDFLSIFEMKEKMCSEKDKFNTSKNLYIYGEDGRLYKVDVNVTIEMTNNVPVNVLFYLYTNAAPEKPEELFLNDTETLRKSDFNSTNPTVFVTHGFMSSATAQSCMSIKNAFLATGNYNVIAVDWSSSADTYQYLIAKSKVPDVASSVAKMVKFLEDNGLNSTQTLIGHSLGAHVMGLAGHKLDGTIEHVVGLDPALPGFEKADDTQRISVSSGKFVEIIHTNAGELGYVDPIGHRDFYPNGGNYQRGCVVDPVSACSHSRSYFLYADAVSGSKPMVGARCASNICFEANGCSSITSIVAKSTDLKTTGKFYFVTRSKSLYSLGMCGIRIDVKNCQYER